MLLFGLEMWVLSSPMAQRLEVFHVGFLRQVTELKSKRLRDGSWHKVVIEKVIQGAGRQQLQTYLDRRQEKVAE